MMIDNSTAPQAYDGWQIAACRKSCELAPIDTRPLPKYDGSRQCVTR